MKGHILAIVGGQFGSEGKGVVVNHIADRYDVHVRVGGPQAGHSFTHKGTGKVFKQQVVPCGWTNPNATLILGRGMLVHPDYLVDEIDEIYQVDPTIIDRIKIDRKAGMMDDVFAHDKSSQAREVNIGSTGEGVGAARVARIQRNPKGFCHMEDCAENYGTANFSLADMMVNNTPWMLDVARLRGTNILLEGTQGCGLSLIHGPWPYTTNHDTNVGQLAADIGIPPRFIDRTLLVLRTYPIRVASPPKGTSGGLKDEITWAEISKRMGRPTTEQTTVTKRSRRIGSWDEDLFQVALTLNAPTSLAIMFMDYHSPEDEGKTEFNKLSGNARRFVKYLETFSGVPVSLVGTGGDGWKVVDRGIDL